MTISVCAMGCAISALPAFNTVNIGPGVTAMNTSGRMLPPTINWASALDPCARPWKLSFKLRAAADLIGPSIREPIEPAYATSKTGRSAAEERVGNPEIAAPSANQPPRARSSRLLRFFGPGSIRFRSAKTWMYDLIRYETLLSNDFRSHP